MQAPFDIAADLDTPVSAYLKLRALRPRFLLESVERGERLARFSFLGFGDALDIRLDETGLTVGDSLQQRPSTRQDYLNALRAALANAPRPEPVIDGLPFGGGLVGVSGYDVVRLFEKLPRRTVAQSGIPDAAFCAPSSLLVFDHLTRRIALLHDGSTSERQAIRKEVMRALRGAIPNDRHKVASSPAQASLSEKQFRERVEACREYIAAGEIYQIGPIG